MTNWLETDKEVIKRIEEAVSKAKKNSAYSLFLKDLGYRISNNSEFNQNDLDTLEEISNLIEKV